jgi:hypothetical protein
MSVYSEPPRAKSSHQTGAYPVTPLRCGGKQRSVMGRPLRLSSVWRVWLTFWRLVVFAPLQAMVRYNWSPAKALLRSVPQ